MRFRENKSREHRIVRSVQPITGDPFAPGDHGEVGTQFPGESAIPLRASIVTLTATVEAVEPGGRIILREDAGQRSLRMLQRLTHARSVLVTLHPEAPEVGSTTSDLQTAIDLVANAARVSLPREEAAPYQRLMLLAQAIDRHRAKG